MENEYDAIRELAKTAGKGIDATREIGSFIAKYIGGPLEQGIGIFEDRLKFLRWERQIRLIRRVQEILDESGLKAPTQNVSMKILIPILQGATLEENDSLQDIWANLLVNAANASFGEEVRSSYISILEQLSPLDAQILNTLYSLPFNESQHNGILTAELPEIARISEEDRKENPLPPNDEVVICLSNLVRLGCLRPEMTWGGGEVFGRVNPTIAGRAFVNACHIRKP